jgi:hypothetical protein
MFRPIRSSGAAAILLLSSLQSGCDVDLGDLDLDLGCAFGSFAGGLWAELTQPIAGREGVVELAGICGVFDACDASSPLAAGATYPTFLHAIQDQGTELGALVLEEGEASLDVEADCGTVSGELGALEPGTLVLAVTHGGETVDHFDLEIARATSLAVVSELSEIDAYPTTVRLSAELRDALGRRLAPGDLPSWELAMDGLLVLDERLEPRGATLSLTATGPGSTVVILRAGDLEISTTIELPEPASP